MKSSPANRPNFFFVEKKRVTVAHVQNVEVEFGLRFGADGDYHSTAEGQLEADILRAVSEETKIANHEPVLLVLGEAPAELEVWFNGE